MSINRLEKIDGVESMCMMRLWKSLYEQRQQPARRGIRIIVYYASLHMGQRLVFENFKIKTTKEGL